MSWVITGAQKTDPDALAYLAEVERADGQALESGVRDAVIAFVTGCKADGIWSAIKASCILAGARTLTGALVPLVGSAPTNNNFVAGDYNRETGLVGDGSTKFLDTNRACSSDGQNNVHVSVSYASRQDSTARYLGGRQGSVTLEIMGNNSTGFTVRCQSSSIYTVGTSTGGGFIGVSRNSSTEFSWRDNKTSGFQGNTSTNISPGNYTVYGNNSTASNRTSARLAFYSIGESLDLALLDARVTDLINAFAAAIP
jgi:hypothetical protein